MSTSYYSCGCSISSSMFGKRELLNVSTCPKHALLMQKELKALSLKMRKVISEEIKNK